MKYICPVCVYPMDEEAGDYNICSCCGTEFGLHDERFTHQQLRADWIREGAKWWSVSDGPPANWDPTIQLGKLYPQPKGEPSMSLYIIGRPIKLGRKRHRGRIRPRPVVMEKRQTGFEALGA